MMTKTKLREAAQAYYQAQTIDERTLLMQQVVKQVTQSTAWVQAKSIALTLAQDNEIPTQLLIETALLQGKHVYLPRVAPKRQLQFVAINEETHYERHRFGMLEPVGETLTDVEQLDLIVVPGLAFNANGDRVGFGGGYYDRLLAQYPQIKTIAAVTQSFYMDTVTWDIDVFDQPVQQVIVIGEKDD